MPDSAPDQPALTRHQRNLLIAITAGALVLGAFGGALVGIFVAAPDVTDLRNACVANQVVPSAGLKPGTVQGPRTSGVNTTPPVVTPVQGR